MLDINKAHYSTCHIWYKNRYDGGFDHFLDLPTALGQILAAQQQGGGLEPPECTRGTLYPRKKLYLPKSYMGFTLVPKNILCDPPKVLSEKNYTTVELSISVRMHFRENLRVPAERP